MCFQNCSWCTRLFVVYVRSSVSLFFVLFSFSITCGSYSFTLCVAFESLIGSDIFIHSNNFWWPCYSNNSQAEVLCSWLWIVDRMMNCNWCVGRVWELLMWGCCVGVGFRFSYAFSSRIPGVCENCAVKDFVWNKVVVPWVIWCESYYWELKWCSHKFAIGWASYFLKSVWSNLNEMWWFYSAKFGFECGSNVEFGGAPLVITIAHPFYVWNWQPHFLVPLVR